MRTYVLAVVYAGVASILGPLVLISVVAFIMGYLGYREFITHSYIGISLMLILNLIAVYVSSALMLRFVRPRIPQSDEGNFLLISTLCFLIMNMFFFIAPLPGLTGYVAVYLINAFVATGVFYYRTAQG